MMPGRFNVVVNNTVETSRTTTHQIIITTLAYVLELRLSNIDDLQFLVDRLRKLDHYRASVTTIY